MLHAAWMVSRMFTVANISPAPRRHGLVFGNVGVCSPVLRHMRLASLRVVWRRVSCHAVWCWRSWCTMLAAVWSKAVVQRQRGGARLCQLCLQQATRIYLRLWGTLSQHSCRRTKVRAHAPSCTSGYGNVLISRATLAVLKAQVPWLGYAPPPPPYHIYTNNLAPCVLACTHPHQHCVFGKPRTHRFQLACRRRDRPRLYLSHVQGTFVQPLFQHRASLERRTTACGQRSPCTRRNLAGVFRACGFGPGASSMALSLPCLLLAVVALAAQLHIAASEGDGTPPRGTLYCRQSGAEGARSRVGRCSASFCTVCR